MSYGLVEPNRVPSRWIWKRFASFAKAGASVFGSGLAGVPFLYGGGVKEFHWLTEKQFIDAVAMIAPGTLSVDLYPPTGTDSGLHLRGHGVSSL